MPHSGSESTYPTVQFSGTTSVKDYMVNVVSSVSGHISLQGVVSSSTAFTLIGPTVTLIPDAGGTSTTVVVASDGSFDFSILSGGSYDLVATPPGFISALRQGLVLVGPSIELSPVELRAGLVDGDDVVSIRDISASAASFGQVIVDRIDAQGRVVDMNANGIVDILDISAIASNFGSFAPILWIE